VRSEAGVAQLGRWLESNVEVVVGTALASLDLGVGDREARDTLAHIRRLLTQSAARWLITDDPVQARALGQEAYRAFAPLAANTTISREALTKRCFQWRDSVITALGYGATELGVSPPALERAASTVRASADFAMLKMVQLFETDLRATRHLVQQGDYDMAKRDPVTELANRTAFHAHLAALTSGPADTWEKIAVLVVDLDRFELLNDTLGPSSGDQVLRLLAKRLAGTVRGHELIARVDSATFGFVLRDPDALIGALSLTARIHALLADSFPVADIQYALSATIGIAVGPEHGWNGDVLLARAGSALRFAQQTKRKSAVYDPSSDTNTRQQLTLLHDLRQALDYDDLVMHYQPKLDLASDRIVGVEALLRWQHPRLGLLGPDEFLPLAEAAGVMNRITEIVIDKSLRQVALWRAAGIDLDISINLSATDLHDKAIVNHLKSSLAHTQVPADRVIVEITETLAVTDRPTTSAVLSAITALGVRVSVDDFGTGYSALAHLVTLPVHELKIDRAFLHDDLQATQLAVIASIAALGHTLGHTVVAEGIEDPAILATIKNAGCDQAQGYAISRPVPPHELRDWLANRTVLPSTSS